MRLDSHQHFWNYNPAEHVWMTDRMGTLKRNFLPEDLKPLLALVEFDGCIAVQARQNLEETRWLLELANNHEFIAGVVGWVDLCSPGLPGQLDEFVKHPKFVGVRHVVQDEPDDRFMLRPDFQRGIAQLRPHGLTYDLLVFPKHLPVAVRLVEHFPEQPFVLDHLGNPPIAEGLMSPWQEQVRELAKFPHVSCKLSGMVTRATWGQWEPHHFHRYLDTVLEAFGPSRVMIGSDWPVCTLSGSYQATMEIVLAYAQQFRPDERAGIFGENCARFYRILGTAKLDR
jgi:L-fuconolactonase